MDDNDVTTRPGVRVHAQVIMKGLHERYGRQIGQLVQENAEVAAALAATQDRCEELEAKLQALTGGGE